MIRYFAANPTHLKVTVVQDSAVHQSVCLEQLSVLKQWAELAVPSGLVVLQTDV